MGHKHNSGMTCARRLQRKMLRRQIEQLARASLRISKQEVSDRIMLLSIAWGISEVNIDVEILVIECIQQIRSINPAYRNNNSMR